MFCCMWRITLAQTHVGNLGVSLCRIVVAFEDSGDIAVQLNSPQGGLWDPCMGFYVMADHLEPPYPVLRRRRPACFVPHVYRRSVSSPFGGDGRERRRCHHPQQPHLSLRCVAPKFVRSDRESGELIFSGKRAIDEDGKCVVADCEDPSNSAMVQEGAGRPPFEEVLKSLRLCFCNQLLVVQTTPTVFESESSSAPVRPGVLGRIAQISRVAL